MRNRAGGIYIKDGKILLMHRIKEIDGKINEYYVIPGGKVEENETLKETTIREIEEEIGIKVKLIQDNPKYIYKTEEGNQYFMLVDYISGVIGTGTGPEFTNNDYAKNGKYIVEMISLMDIIDGKINMVPETIKNKLINEIQSLNKKIEMINSLDMINNN